MSFETILSLAVSGGLGIAMWRLDKRHKALEQLVLKGQMQEQARRDEELRTAHITAWAQSLGRAGAYIAVIKNEGPAIARNIGFVLIDDSGRPTLDRYGNPWWPFGNEHKGQVIPELDRHEKFVLDALITEMSPRDTRIRVTWTDDRGEGQSITQRLSFKR